jgi:hypothetical protein
VVSDLAGCALTRTRSLLSPAMLPRLPARLPPAPSIRPKALLCSHNDVRKSLGDPGKDADQKARDEHEADEGRDAVNDVRQRNVGSDVLDREDVEADGGWMRRISITIVIGVPKPEAIEPRGPERTG